MTDTTDTQKIINALLAIAGELQYLNQQVEDIRAQADGSPIDDDEDDGPIVPPLL